MLQEWLPSKLILGRVANPEIRWDTAVGCIYPADWPFVGCTSSRATYHTSLGYSSHTHIPKTRIIKSSREKSPDQRPQRALILCRSFSSQSPPKFGGVPHNAGFVVWVLTLAHVPSNRKLKTANRKRRNAKRGFGFSHEVAT
jgi:hypothetical protein